ncbi:MAG TPA: Fe-S cluster assembly protein SufD [Candidatus Binatia bacterium]|jgi:Fe-S cluster assembly protein SufD|nr:Fe-S cluster assembly protein SufD [Candidatus Binatia bacterium]
MVEVSKELDSYLSDFERFEKNGAVKGPSWVQQIRKAAISRFATLGFPTTRHEEWKYTSVAPLVKVRFKLAAYELNGLTADRLARVTFGEVSCAQLVFVNGHYSRELSFFRSLPDGVKAGSLAAALHADPALVEPHLARYASYQDHPFVSLNTAFMEDGAFVYVPQGMVVEEPIHLLFVSTIHEKPTVSHPRNLIVVDNDSQATIVESYVGLENDVYFTNVVSEIRGGENAIITHYRLQQESQEAFHIATVQAHLRRSSNFSSHSIALGGALVRNDVTAALAGEGSECTLNGLYMVTGHQQVDNHTRIDHEKPHCRSRELYKGILDGKSKGIFNGKIFVHKAAQKTDAKQTNKNLLLSEDAVINTKPQLEIYADDVKCTHGSTIGQLDQDAMFYLRSRGIGLQAARRLLTYAFASEIITQIKIEPVRTQLDHLLTTRL